MLLNEVALALGVSVARVLRWERLGWVRVRRPRPRVALVRQHWFRKLMATLAVMEPGVLAKAKRRQGAYDTKATQGPQGDSQRAADTPDRHTLDLAEGGG